MNPVIPCSVGNVSLVPGITFSTRKSSYLTRLSFSRIHVKNGSSTRLFLFPSFASSGVFQQNNRRCAFHKKSRTSVAATETDVAVEEQGSPAAVTDEVSGGTPSDEVGTSEDSSPKSDANPAAAKASRSRSPRKSEMPPVKNEELVPGATFTGKVKSIQPFGAFIDFGAFTDGLVHVSMLSDNFVKDVSSVVSIGQEVKVKLIEVNTETKRISLSMRQNADAGKQRKDAPANSTEKAGAGKRNTSKPGPRKDGARKSSKFVKGQDLQGTVKNMTRSGAFISLPDGEEGFLPVSEELSDGFENVMGNTSLEVGQEVSVRVLRIARGSVTLTMKKEEDVAEFDSEVSQGVVHTATNPFALAFSKNKDIASFLDERKKSQNEVEKPSTTGTSQGIEESVKEEKTVVDAPDVQGELESTDKLTDDVPSAVQDAEDVIPENEADAGASASSTTGTLQEIEEPVKEEETVSDAPEVQDELEITNKLTDDAPSAVQDAEDVIPENEADVGASAPSTTGALQEIEEPVEDKETVLDSPDVQGELESTDKLTDSIPSAVQDAEDVIPENEADVGASASGLAAESAVIEEAAQTDDNLKAELPLEIASENVIESGVDDVVVEDEKQLQDSSAKDEVASTEQADSDAVKPSPDNGDSVPASDIAASVPTPIENTVETEENDQIPSPESLATEVVKDPIDDRKEEVQNPTPYTENGNSIISQVEDKEVAIVSENNDGDTSLKGQNGELSPKGSSNKVTISPVLVKQLREETGAGMMECKKALSETGGDIVKAQEYLRKKGLSSAEKKASRVTAEGRIGSYIHDSRIGVLVEVNCETDFVSRGDIFKELVDDIAMQVAACPQVEYLVTDDVPEEIVNKEKELEMQKEDLLSKPEQIRSKIVEGRIRKRLEDLALLDQPYIKNDKVVVKDWIKQTIATIGENIKVKRFVRFNLGEGLEKKSQDFAAEVAAQTAAKAAPAPPPAVEQPAVAEAKTEQKQATVAVSAALVKQLREETGAGMMDCKKALAETGGDLEKAQEYLRKKGLSTADKKSSRLAAEGRIGSYIHDSRIGVLIEVNCETDFVGRSEKFKELVDDLAMQVVACPQVQFVSIEDIPEDIVKKEKDLEMQREDLLSKPENIREKIVEGRISKRLGELVLLEQPFIKDDSVLVKDLVKQSVAAIGENIKVRRFVRFTLGETAEKETAPAAE